MSFNLYLAGAQHKDIDLYIQQQKMNRLFSFADKNDKVLNDYIVNAKDSKLFMDSGAFSVFHNGAVIDIDKYIDFVNNTDGITVWAQLDDIPFPVLDEKTRVESSEGSWKKYIYCMERLKEERKDSFIPIYHFGEPVEHLERILNTEIDGRLAPYIGVGGRHGQSTKAHDDYFTRIFDIVKRSKNPNVKIHAFGMTVLDLLEKYPFHSADSTTWLIIGVNGSIMTKSCGMVLVSDRQSSNKAHFNHYKPELKKLMYDEFEEKGFKFEDISKNYKERLKWNVSYYKDWSDNYQYRPPKKIMRRLLVQLPTPKKKDSENA